MLIREVGAAWQQAQRRDRVACSLPWSNLQPLSTGATAGWGVGQGRDQFGRSAWRDAPAADLASVLNWDTAAPRSVACGSRWDDVDPKDRSRCLGWNHSIRARDLRLHLIYNPMPGQQDSGVRQVWQRSDEFGPRYDSAGELLASLYVPGSSALQFSFEGQRYSPSSSPLVFFDFRYEPAPRAIQPVDSGVGVSFSSARQLSKRLTLPWGWGRPTEPVPTGITYPDYTGPVYVIDTPDEPDILETYMIANLVTLVVLPDRTPIEVTNIKLGLDIDAYSWSFSADVAGRTALNLVKPDAGGQKTLELTINGWTWNLLVERYSRKQNFPGERYSIQGATRSQLLAAPYAPLRSNLNAAPINARQAAENELLNTGFTLNWDSAALGPADWTIPAGAFSYQSQTAMQVIARIAEATGGVIRPARDSDALSVLPRYREASWNWGAALLDRIIPAAIMTELAGDWTPQPAWNTVYVSGTNQGVGVRVRRTGTAGDNPAPDVLDDLITDTAAARSRGICELSKGGNVSIETFYIPLFPPSDTGNPGLVEPAMLCEVREPEGGDIWRGLCLGTDISAEGVGAVRVKQTLRLERHY
ncbi:hypothetical protein [Pseudomonas sp. S9]|uniref:hypothetical protein n=1 Tax=Pseudomonas sp. S9 TaxID=686578 RepID=UPI0002557000|nr:hypothetical protein [Pseudomonas sp. S9]